MLILRIIIRKALSIRVQKPAVEHALKIKIREQAPIIQFLRYINLILDSCLFIDHVNDSVAG